MCFTKFKFMLLIFIYCIRKVLCLNSLRFYVLLSGGLTMKEESCIVLSLYYPRQNKLTTCHSLPSLPTVLHSLGIEQLAT